MPLAYLFYNLLFMVSLMWAVAVRDSIDAIHTVKTLQSIELQSLMLYIFFQCAAINFSSIFFDFVIIISYFGHAQIWAIIFAVFNLVARPFSLLLLHKEVVDRGGDFVIVSPLPTNISNGSRTPRSYQDIDSPRQASGQQLPSF